MELIRLDQVGFAYPGRPAVFHGLDFVLNSGERIGVLGPNGAGKSTLFLIIMGLARPLAGAVRLFGQPMASERDFQGARTAVGYCFQDPDDQLFCPTVLEDVAFGPLNQGQGRNQATAAARQTLVELGLAHLEERVTHQLSGGEKRLVSLATVFAMHPQALLLDEPTAGLDPATQDRLEKVLLGSDLPWAIISHDHAFLRRTCTRLLWLEAGRLLPV